MLENKKNFKSWEIEKSKIAEIAGIVKQILIGKDIEVFYSKDKKEIGKRGRCVEDRANILVLETVDGEKKIIKKNSWFLIHTNDYKILVDGKKLVSRIEKRLKKL